MCYMTKSCCTSNQVSFYCHYYFKSDYQAYTDPLNLFEVKEYSLTTRCDLRLKEWELLSFKDPFTDTRIVSFDCIFNKLIINLHCSFLG